MPLDYPRLAGRHVSLEPLTLAHLDGLWAAAQQLGDTGRLTTVPRSESETRSYIETALSLRAADLAHPFAIVAQPSGEIVGSTRLATFETWSWGDQIRPERLGPDAVEIGWTWLTQGAQRTPINTEAKYLLLSYAFEVMRVERVMLKTDARNTRSRNAIERIGASFEGILRSHGPAADGGVRDTAMFSIIAPEWPRVKRELEHKLAR